MMRTIIRKGLFLLALSVVSSLAGIAESWAQPINLYEPDTWERPVLIAHRGGVVTSEASENSAAAVRLAAEQGFAMVEVDVRESKDHVPVAFHDGNLTKAVGIDARIEDLTLAEIKAVRHRQTGQEILTLDEYLALCSERELGVMLDIKTDGSDRFFREIAALLEKYQLSRSAITFTGHPLAIQYLADDVMFAITEDEEKKVEQDEAFSLAGKFWFGLPHNISDEMIGKLQSRGALVIPAINIFRYPSDKHMELAEKDIVRMRNAGVDAYQIDAVYAPLFQDGSGSADAR